MNAPSDRYSKAFDWIMSDESPEVTDATVHEVMPQIAAELRNRFNLALSETVELLGIVADCEALPTSTEIEQIARRVYSADPAASAVRLGKRYKSELEDDGCPISPNTDLAMAFLYGLDSHGRHDLVAIDPDLPNGAPGKIECATFLPTDREKMRGWIEARQGKKNLYASVNRSRDDAPHNVRLNQKDIAYIRAIPADIDVPKIKGGDPSGLNFRAARARLLGEVAPKLGGNPICPPSLAVDSGGGLQLWWVLRPAVLATAENIELVRGIGRTINERLKSEFPDFNFDTVTDPARIMRLPGTINIPDAGKRSQGRSPTPATVLVEHSAPTDYTIDQLKDWASPSHKTKANSSGTGKLPPIDMDLVHSVDDYKELPEELRARFEAICTENEVLRDLWDGIPPPWQRDESGSGFANALAWLLKSTGKFAPTEYGRLLWVWGRASVPEKMDARYIARTWARATPRVNTSSWPEPIDCSSEATDSTWDEPTDFWAGKSEPADLPLGVLPEVVERFTVDRGRRLGVELGALAACLITTLASAIAATNTLQMRQKDPHWTVKPILWTAIIGDSGTNKSATLDAAMRPVEALEALWRKEYIKEKRLYEEQERANKMATSGAGLRQ
jgi:Protein of unknown function (DUF3987)